MTLTTRQVPVVGRRSQVMDLARIIGESGGAGASQVVLVTGEAGIGKSTLIDQVRHLVPDPAYLVGRCLDLENPPSYAPFVAILRDLSRDGRLAQARKALSPHVEAALSWLLPEFQALPEVPAGPRVHVFDAVLTLLEELSATTPVVLVIEDVHWADQSTWDLLLFIIGNASDTRLTVVVTYRDLPTGHPLRGPLAGVSRLPQASQCALEGLRRADVAVLFAALAGSPPSHEETDEVMRLSSGNPLFVEAAVSLIHHRGPGLGHQQLLLAPIERLPAETQAVIRIVAVSGSSILHRTLLLLSGAEEPALEAALRPAVERRVLAATDDGYRFRHDLIARLVHDELLLPSERTRLHRVMAEEITKDPSLAPPIAFHSTREIARHWREAGDTDRALPATWRAAQEGRHSLAHPERLRLLQDVLALWPAVPEASSALGVSRAHVLHDAVEAAEESGRSELGLDLAGQALTEAMEAGESDTAAAVLERRSRLRAQMGVAGAAEDLHAALELLPASPSPLRAQLLAQLADRLRWAGNTSAATPLAAESLSVAQAADDRYGIVRARLAKLGLLSRTDLAAARAGVSEACAEAQGLGIPVLDALAAFAQAELETLAGERHHAVAAARRGLRATRGAGQEATLGARLAAQLAESLTALGQWDEATEALEHALELDPPPGYRARLLALQGTLLHARGEAQRAQEVRAALQDLKADRPRWADLDTDAAVAALSAALDLESGRNAAALATVLDTSRAWPEGDVPQSAWPLLFVAASALRHAPAGDAALPTTVDGTPRDLVAMWVDRAPALGPETLAWRSTLQAELTTGRARLADAREQELDAWRATSQPEQLGWALVRSSYALLASSKKIEAVDRLREARHLAESLGALPLVRAAEELGKRAGLDLSPRRQEAPSPKPAHGLTPREAEVLGLISLGRTNRQIGEELFISAKTASIHVSRILTKLGVANRGEAAAQAHRLGIAARGLDDEQAATPAR